jgi:anion-transporting  ArsA/GET3 family ATPase
MSARLHVLLGGGGVGKTTLAAGYALALARRGGRVGLLGIDPSRRLQDALGLDLADLDAPVPDAGALRAAIVHPHQALTRWVTEASSDPAALARLEHNAFFAALGDRLATATDILAAVRIAEWAERDPALTDLVVDTAPGLAAVDFLRSPRQVAALFDGTLVRWLRSAARSSEGRLPSLSFGARRVLGVLGRFVGTQLVTDLADFFALARAPLEGMLGRITAAQRWLRSVDTELLIVTSPRDTDASAARQLAEVLRIEQLTPRAVIVNRTWSVEFATELAAVEPPVGAEALVGHARAQLAAQARVFEVAATLSRAVVALPSSPGLDLARRPALAALGEALVAALGGG